MKDPDLNPLKFLWVRFTKLHHHVLDFREILELKVEGHGEMASVLHQPISVLGLLDLLKIDLGNFGLPSSGVEVGR